MVEPWYPSRIICYMRKTLLKWFSHIWTSGLHSLLMRWLTGDGQLSHLLSSHWFFLYHYSGLIPEQTDAQYCMVWFTKAAWGRGSILKVSFNTFKKRKGETFLFSTTNVIQNFFHVRPKVLYCEKCKCCEPPLHSSVYPFPFPNGSVDKELACQYRRHRSCGFDLWVRKIPWRRKWQPTPVFLPGKSHGQKSLAGYSPWDHKGLTWLTNTTPPPRCTERRGVPAGDPGAAAGLVFLPSPGTWCSVELKQAASCQHVYLSHLLQVLSIFSGNTLRGHLLDSLVGLPAGEDLSPKRLCRVRGFRTKRMKWQSWCVRAHSVLRKKVNDDVRLIISSLQYSQSVVSNSLQPHGLQHTRPPCMWPTPGAYSNSCSLSRWCHPTISSSVVPFSSCL